LSKKPRTVPSMKSLESSPAAKLFFRRSSRSLEADDDRSEPPIGSSPRRQVRRRTNRDSSLVLTPADCSGDPVAQLDPLLSRQQREASRGPAGGNEPPGRRHDAGEIRQGGPRPQPFASPPHPAVPLSRQRADEQVHLADEDNTTFSLSNDAMFSHVIIKCRHAISRTITVLSGPPTLTSRSPTIPHESQRLAASR
jgi:hypothetical protein